MFELVYKSGPHGDATSWYYVEPKKGCTIGDFIDEVLKNNKDEWGCIDLFLNTDQSYTKRILSLEYRYGKLITPIAFEIRPFKIIKGIANGGWSCMDYKLIVGIPDMY